MTLLLKYVYIIKCTTVVHFSSMKIPELRRYVTKINVLSSLATHCSKQERERDRATELLVW